MQVFLLRKFGRFVAESTYYHCAIPVLFSSSNFDIFLPSMQFCFAIMYRRENQRQYELRAEKLSECQSWIQDIKAAR